MAAPVGNQFWKARSSHGRHRIFESPEVLWAACVEYFEWVDANPLIEEKLFSSEGKVITGNASKMRAMTLAGLCIFLDIGRRTWREYQGRPEFEEAVSKIEAIIETQKFEGAAAGLLNPVIISRDIGLSEKVEHGVTDSLAQMLTEARRRVAEGR